MPTDSTLVYVAELVIRRVLANAEENTNLAEALDAAFPFDESPKTRKIWLDAINRLSAEVERESGKLESEGSA